MFGSKNYWLLCCRPSPIPVYPPPPFPRCLRDLRSLWGRACQEENGFCAGWDEDSETFSCGWWSMLDCLSQVKLPPDHAPAEGVWTECWTKRGCRNGKTANIHPFFSILCLFWHVCDVIKTTFSQHAFFAKKSTIYQTGRRLPIAG